MYVKGTKTHSTEDEQREWANRQGCSPGRVRLARRPHAAVTPEKLLRKTYRTYVKQSLKDNRVDVKIDSGDRATRDDEGVQPRCSNSPTPPLSANPSPSLTGPPSLSLPLPSPFLSSPLNKKALPSTSSHLRTLTKETYRGKEELCLVLRRRRRTRPRRCRSRCAWSWWAASGCGHSRSRPTLRTMSS